CCLDGGYSPHLAPDRTGPPMSTVEPTATPENDQPMSEDMTPDRVQELVARAPYHKWLGLKVVAVHDDGIELTATWREEWVVNPDRRYTHGGILSTLARLAADWGV